MRSALVFTLALALTCACGGARAPDPQPVNEDRPIPREPPDDPALNPISTAEASRSERRPIALGFSERACKVPTDCAADERCASAEEHRWNACGADSAGTATDCLAGEVRDNCGRCHLACSNKDNATPCPNGFSCNGLVCVSPRRCGKASR